MNAKGSGRCVLAAVLFGAWFGTGSAVAGPLYTVTDLGVRSAAGLNDAGQVALTDSTVVSNPSNLPPNSTLATSTPARYDGYGPKAGQITYVAPPASSPQTIPPVLEGSARGITGDGRVLVNTTLTDGQTATNLLPGGTNPYAPNPFVPNAVNDAGQAVGTFSDPATGRLHGYVLDGKTATDLGSLQGGNTVASGINNQGQVVGTSYIPNPGGGPQAGHAFVYNNGQMTDLGTLPGGTSSYATGVNNLGQIVGGSTASAGPGYAPSHAFLYSNGQMTDLGTLVPGKFSEAIAINDKGQIVGSADPGNAPSHAVLFQGGQVLDLNSLIDQNLHIQLTRAIAINNAGQILVQGNAFDPYQSAYLLTPVGLPAPTPPTNLPEPGAWAVLVFAGAALGAKRLRRTSLRPASR